MWTRPVGRFEQAWCAMRGSAQSRRSTSAHLARYLIPPIRTGAGVIFAAAPQPTGTETNALAHPGNRRHGQSARQEFLRHRRRRAWWAASMSCPSGSRHSAPSTRSASSSRASTTRSPGANSTRWPTSRPTASTIRRPCRRSPPASMSSARSRSRPMPTKAMEMTEAIEKAGLVGMVNFTYRNSPALQKGRQMVLDGDDRRGPPCRGVASAELARRQGLGRLEEREQMALASVEEARLQRRARRHRHPYRRFRVLRLGARRRACLRAAEDLRQGAPATGSANTTSTPMTASP